MGWPAIDNAPTNGARILCCVSVYGINTASRCRARILRILSEGNGPLNSVPIGNQCPVYGICKSRILTYPFDLLHLQLTAWHIEIQRSACEELKTKKEFLARSLGNFLSANLFLATSYRVI